MLLEQGAVLDCQVRKSRFRIVDFCSERSPGPNQFVFVAEINAKRFNLERWSYAETLTKVANRLLAITESAAAPVNLRALTPKARKRWDERVAIARHFESKIPQIYDPAYRGQVIRDLAAADRGSRPTLFNILETYLVSGRNEESLIPGYHKRGAPGVDRATAGTGAKLGRPREVLPGIGLTLTDDDIRQMIVAFARIKTPSAAAIRKAWYWMLIRYYADHVRMVPKRPAYWDDPDAEEDDLEVEIENADLVPSLNQFTHHYEKSVDLATRLLKKWGRIRFDQETRLQTTGTIVYAESAGRHFYIDSTTIDNYVVASFDRNRVVGRPTLYCVVDALTRLIAGVHIGLEPPNWIGGLLALYNCCVDKVSFCATHGITIEPWQWPTTGLPIHLLGDRGDQFAKDTEHLAGYLKIVPDTTPPYRGDAKSVVERVFGVLQAEFGPFLPGYVYKPPHDRPITRPELRAALTLEEMTKTILLQVLNANRRTITNYPKELRQNAASVAAKPLDMWHWCAKELLVTTRTRSDLDDVKRHLWPRLKLKTTKRALQLCAGLRFSGEDLERQTWFFEARHKASDLFEAVYHPSRVDEILVVSDKMRDISFHAELTKSSSRRFKGLSLSEVMVFGKKSRQIDAAADYRDLPDVAANSVEAERVAAAAVKRTASERDPTLTKTDRTSNIRENKDAEIARNQADALGLGGIVQTGAVSVCPFEHDRDQAAYDALKARLHGAASFTTEQP